MTRATKKENLMFFMAGVACIIALILSFLMVRDVFASEIRAGGKICLYPSGRELIVSEGAVEPLSKGYSYTETDIRKMLSALDEMGEHTGGLPEGTKEVYEWHKKTGADVAGLLALIRSDGTYCNSHGIEHWNFFLLPANGTDSSYSTFGGRTYYDAKADCSTVGEALVKGMDFIYRNYYLRGQDSFYKMAFNNYGFPKTLKEAEKAFPEITHSYLPWWEDDAYMSSGFDSEMAWVNRLARYREGFGK